MQTLDAWSTRKAAGYTELWSQGSTNGWDENDQMPFFLEFIVASNQKQISQVEKKDRYNLQV